MLMWLCEAERLTEQPKMWVHFIKIEHHQFSKYDNFIPDI